jgi:hypothetical protein
MRRAALEMRSFDMAEFSALSRIIGLETNPCFQVSVQFPAVIAFLGSVRSFGNYKLLGILNTTVENVLIPISSLSAFFAANLCFSKNMIRLIQSQSSHMNLIYLRELRDFCGDFRLWIWMNQLEYLVN